MSRKPSEHLEFTRSIDAFLSRIGVGSADERADLAVDLADTLYAARDVERMLSELLDVDPESPSQVDRALELTANIEVQLFTELKDHLLDLQQSWPILFEKLGAIAEQADT